jgi:hypothetical protein
MKKKLIAISVITVMSITPAFANYIESPRGISQSEWHASSTYQNFQCPTGTSRGEGVDMNFTTTRSDDFYFVTCSPIIIIPTPTPTPVISETSTVTVIPIITENTNISSSSTSSETTTITPTPVVTETSTSTSTTPTNSTTSTTLTNSQLLTLIMNLINQLMALIAQMK